MPALTQQLNLFDEPEVISAAADAPPAGAIALLLHGDDLHPESLELGSARVVKVGGATAHAEGADDRVRAADREAMADALARVGAHFGCEADAAEPGWEEDLLVIAAWAPSDRRRTSCRPVALCDGSGTSKPGPDRRGATSSFVRLSRSCWRWRAGPSSAMS